MVKKSKEHTAKVISNIKEVSPNDWDSCANHSNPFVRHSFLCALEESGSVSANTGWQPQHILIYDKEDILTACMPMYLKSHSYGEYIFDWGWGEAYEKAGGKYYPKLQSSVPFTPATGNRLLVRDNDSKADYGSLINAMLKLSREHQVSSLHVTFLPQFQWKILGEAGFVLRTSKQFHWENIGYSSFEDFLLELSSRKRKAIRKERETINKQNIKLKILTGHDLDEHHWDTFYSYYLNTIDRKWGHPYLTRDFFSMIGSTMPELVILVTAEHEDEYIAGALNFVGDDTIFGRNWGCSRNIKYLHFEACYYQAIEYAINHKLKWVEAGAQGPHKIQRGYLPKEVYSAHWIENLSFRKAVENYVEQERLQVEHEISALMGYSPYRYRNNDL